MLCLGGTILDTTMLLLYLAWNFAAFCLVGSDKRRAQSNRWRVRERTFFGMGLFFGAAGVLAGMYLYRHKTRHMTFVIGMPLLLILNLLFLHIAWS